MRAQRFLYRLALGLCLLICTARVGAWGQIESNPQEHGPLRQPLPVLRRGIVPVVPPAAQQEDAPDTSRRGETSQSESPHVLSRHNDRTVQRPLATADLDIARAAWHYFGANRQSETGLFNAVHNYPFTTMWDMASAVAGLVAAEQLGIIDGAQFTQDIKRLLDTLVTLALYNQELPNREYNAQTGKMVDLKNAPSQKGSGWSAIDIGRLLIWLRIVSAWYPELTDQVRQVVERWKFDRLAYNQEMYGVLFNGRSESVRQEGRLGYEQYAAAGFALWGIHLPKALAYGHIAYADILGTTLPYDSRNLAFLTSEPFFLATLEMGSIDETFDQLVRDIYHVQKRRWETFGIWTAVSEDTIAREPWFVYNTIYMDGQAWQCVSHNGRPYPTYKSLSAKAAFAWSALYPDAYAQQLRQQVQALVHPHYGYYAGLFETGETNQSLNINTNAVILEAMLYNKRGQRPFLRSDAP